MYGYMFYYSHTFKVIFGICGFDCSFFSLRAYVGGIHLKHYLACLICSCLIITLLLVVAHTWNPDLRVSVIITAAAFFLINLLAPVATKDRVNDYEEAAFLIGNGNVFYLELPCWILFLYY